MGKLATDKMVAFIHTLMEQRDLDGPRSMLWPGEPDSPTIGQFFRQEYGKYIREGDWPYAEARNAIDTLKSAPWPEVPESEQTGTFTGEPGKRREWDVTVQAVNEIDSGFGLSNLVKMTTNEPNPAEIAWFDRNMSDLHIGDELHITGTVKAHKSFRGKKSTTIIRVKYDVLARQE